MIVFSTQSSRARPSDSPKGEDRATARAPFQTLGAWTNNEQNSKQIKPHIIRAFVAKNKHMKKVVFIIVIMAFAQTVAAQYPVKFKLYVIDFSQNYPTSASPLLRPQP